MRLAEPGEFPSGEDGGDGMPPMAMLRAFDAFGRIGGIRRAADHLGIDHAAVSRHLRALETLVGTALIDRSGGTHRLTDDGTVYHRAISAALADIATETRRLRRRGDGRLSLWCVPGFAFHWLAPRLSRFSEANPEIAVELRPSDRPPSYKTSEVDGDIRYDRDEGASPVEARRVELARPAIFPVCSPAYLAEIGGAVADAAAIMDLRLLHEENDVEWRMWFAAQGLTLAADPLPGSRLWHAHLVLDACRAGRGVALTNHLLLGDDLAAGRLVRLTPQSDAFAEPRLGAYVLTIRRDRWAEHDVVRFRTWIERETQEGGNW
jgi:DNA-binding transcriptional LysR family regulator